MTSVLATATACAYTCLLLYHSSVQGKPSFIENDSIVFPESDNDTTPSVITDKLKECLADNFKIEFNGNCRTLLTTEGVCTENYWLVLDLFSASQSKPVIQGKCAPRRCASQQHYFVELNRCVYPNESSALCPRGNFINTDYFGDGVCECIKDPIHIRDRNGVCFPAFTRGPCPDDRVLVQVNGRVQCRLDNCSVIRFQNPGRIIVPWSDGRCYPLNERGPCVQGNVVRINMYSLRPECGDSLTPLNLLDPVCSGVDHAGKCSPAITTPQNIFYSQIAEQASKKRTKKVLSNPK